MLKDSKALLLPVLDTISRTDPSVNLEKVKAVIQLLDDEASSNPMDDVYSRSKVAATLNMSMKAVDYHCRKGDFKRVYLGNSSRAIGISRRSIEEAMTVR